MKLSDLIYHVESIRKMCQEKGIPPELIDIYFVSDVLWKSGVVKESNKLLKNKKPITSIEVNALEGREFLFYDSTSWEQLQKAKGM